MAAVEEEPLAPPGEIEENAVDLALQQAKMRLLQESYENLLPKTKKERKDEEEAQYKRSRRNKKKRERKKKKQLEKKQQAEEVKNKPAEPVEEKPKKQTIDDVIKENVDVEYVAEQPDFTDPQYFQFKQIFDAFKLAEKVEQIKVEDDFESKYPVKKKDIVEKVRAFGEEEDSSDDEKANDDDGGEKLSKKKMRRMNRLSVAELKQIVLNPEVVEMHDVTAQDPRLLVQLKATRNTVPVPRHWCFKRKYLQGKRGFEKPPFQLPECIKNTGITEMRQALQEKEDARTMKTKMREKVRPKMGKIDIDYQKLHDAFFRYQTKPKLTMHGDLYYERKEFETRLKEKKPGDLTEELKIALGMPGKDSGGQKVPPPWLIAMQRYGPPPSYPNLKIQGLNSPIPEGCSFGYHAGGWGKPPVDEYGRPLYGDVFGVAAENQEEKEDNDLANDLWGTMDSASEDSDSSDEEEEENEEENIDGIQTPAESGMVTPSGISSVPSGMETPDMLELRKRKNQEESINGGETPQLYQVIPQKEAAIQGRAMMGSSHVYDMNQARRVAAAAPSNDVPTGGVEVALLPEELQGGDIMDKDMISAKYDQQVRNQQVGKQGEDFSDLVADHTARQKKKRKGADTNKSSSKKHKNFKF